MKITDTDDLPQQTMIPVYLSERLPRKWESVRNRATHFFFIEKLNVHDFSAKFVVRLFTGQQKENCINIGQKLFGPANVDGDSLETSLQEMRNWDAIVGESTSTTKSPHVSVKYEGDGSSDCKGSAYYDGSQTVNKDCTCQF